MTNQPFAWWMELDVIRAALTVPCSRCGAARGKQCKRGFPHAVRAKSSLASAEVKEGAKQRNAEWKAMTEAQRWEHIKKEMTKILPPRVTADARARSRNDAEFVLEAHAERMRLGRKIEAEKGIESNP